MGSEGKMASIRRRWIRLLSQFPIKSVIGSLLALGLMLIGGVFSEQAISYEQSYAQLKQLIDANKDKPPTDSSLEVYLQWIQTKAGHRDQVKAVLDEVNALYIKDPDNEQYNQWVQKFYELLQEAQNSGTGTVNAASIRHIFIKGADSYDITLTRVTNFARPIFSKARECGFDTYYPKERARCLINYTIGDLESSRSGGGLYRDRELVFGYLDDEGNINIPNRNFSVECERRSEFQRMSEGEPQKTVIWAFEWVDRIREECDWWGFEGEKQDATDLMNEYYEDALCKVPPHKQKLGHKYFRDLAKEYERTEPSVKFNEGFYGTLYGKVEVREDGERKPAPRAKVTVSDYDETWTTTADGEGRYEIKNVILHKDCSPFDISAEYEGDRVDDTYQGPLEKPDKNTRHEKNLLIIPDKQYQWSGELVIEMREKLECDHAIDTPSTTGYESWVKDDVRLVRASIRAKDPPGPLHMIAFRPGDLKASGSLFVGLDYKNRSESRSRKGDAGSVKREFRTAAQSFALDGNALSVTIVKSDLTDQNKLEEMARKIQQGAGDPAALAALQAEMRKMMGQDQKSYAVKVMVQYLKPHTGQIHMVHYVAHRDKNGTRVDRDEDMYWETTISSPVGTEMEGTFTRGEKGDHRISAVIRTPMVQVPFLDHLSTIQCPPEIKTITGHLTLSRKRIK
jgi:hypothetical protein